MNIFKEVKLFFAANATCRHKLLSSAVFDDQLKIAPYVVNALIDYNRDVMALLHNRRFAAHRVTSRGRIQRCRCNLAVGRAKNEDVLKFLRGELLKKDMLLEKDLEQLHEQRIDGQTKRKPHLVQQCNDRETQMTKAYALEATGLINSIREVISSQIVTLTEVESQITNRLGRCMEQIHRFYASLPGHGCREQLRLPTVQELMQIVPMQEFPEEYQTYREEMIELYQKYEEMAEELRKKPGG